MAIPDGKEVWLKLFPNNAVQQVLITIRDGRVMASRSTLAGLVEGSSTTAEDEPMWTITYELMVENMRMNGFRRWPPEDS